MIPDVLIATSAHDVTDARLQRIAEALERAQLDVHVLARGKIAPAPTWRTIPQPGLTGRLLALARIIASPARVLVTLDPELSMVALLWRGLHRGRTVVDVHEDYESVVVDRTWVRPAWQPLLTHVTRWAASAAGRADLTVVADDHVPPHQARRRMVVPNLPDPAVLGQAGARDPTPRAIYVGDVRASRGLFTMVDAVLGTDVWSLDLVGPISEDDRTEVARRRDRASPPDRVRIHGRLPLRDAWSVANGAWAGLAVLEPTPAFRDALPTKVMEYAAVGLPAVVSDLPRMRAFIERTGTGVVVPDQGQLVATLARWSSDPTELDRLQSRAIAWRQERLRGRRPFDALAERVRDLATDTRIGGAS